MLPEYSDPFLNANKCQLGLVSGLIVKSFVLQLLAGILIYPKISLSFEPGMPHFLLFRFLAVIIMFSANSNFLFNSTSYI